MKRWIVDYIEYNAFTEEYDKLSMHFEAISSKDALQQATDLGLEDVVVVGELLMEVPQDEDGNPDWSRAINHDATNNN